MNLSTFFDSHLSQVLKVIKAIEPERVILFGSAVKDDFDRQSDLDICVIKKGDRLQIKNKIVGKLWDDGYDWEVEPDIKIYDPAVYQDWLFRNDPFLQEVEKGKVIYEAKR